MSNDTPGALCSVEKVGEGLAMLRVEWFGAVLGPQLWARCRARRSHTCSQTGRRYQPGEMVYRPVGNTENRSQRILARCIEQWP